MRRAGGFFIAGLTMMVVAGCSHHHRYPVQASAPPITNDSGRGYPSTGTTADGRVHPALPGTSGATPTPIAPPGEVSGTDAEYVETHKPIYSEEGVASWYGPPYNKRQGANGRVYDQNAMTAAHRTLPMGSLIVVTNEKTGQSAIVRVTDRGPFVQGRTLDLSVASAKATGVYLPGVARVRVDVYETPRPMDAGGRWCVQIGAFEHERKAEKLRDQLERRYETASVIDFEGPTGYWVRIRPQGDNRERAEEIVRGLQPEEGDAYLVRLD
jgi:rare lipoprotein A